MSKRNFSRWLAKCKPLSRVIHAGGFAAPHDLVSVFFFGTGGESPCTDIYLSKKTGPSAKRFQFSYCDLSLK
jgi:hypothetical protein